MSGDVSPHGTLYKTGPFSDEEDMQLRQILRDELEVRVGAKKKRKKKKKRRERVVFVGSHAEATGEQKRNVEWNDANLLLVLSGNKSINGLWVSVGKDEQSEQKRKKNPFEKKKLFLPNTY